MKIKSIMESMLIVFVIAQTIFIDGVFSQHPWIMLVACLWMVNRTATGQMKENRLYGALTTAATIGIVYLIVCLNWFEGVLSEGAIVTIVSSIMIVFFVMLSLPSKKESEDEMEFQYR